MADALSRMTCGEEIGVFVMQHGPGAENSFGGVAQAFGESVPVLFMPAGYDRKVANYFPNFNSTLNMKHITKWAEPITMGSEVPNIMRRAFTQRCAMAALVLSWSRYPGIPARKKPIFLAMYQVIKPALVRMPNQSRCCGC